MDREQIMKVIQETLRGLRPPVTLVRRVSYPEGRPPLVYAPIGPGPAEPVTVNNTLIFEWFGLQTK